MTITERIKQEWTREGERLRAAADPSRRATIQQIALRTLLRFFALMLAFTLLSRAAKGMTTARVDTVLPTRGTLTYQIGAEGSITGVSRVPLTLPAGLPVREVRVDQGAPVRQGDPLAFLEPEAVRSLLEKTENEQKKLEAQYSKSKSGATLDRADRGIAVSRAEKALREAEQRAGEAEERAARNRDEAQAAWKKAADRVEGDAQRNYQQALREAQKESDEAQAALESARTSYNKARTEQDRLVQDAKDALEDAEETDDDEWIKEAKQALKRAREDRDFTLRLEDDALRAAQRRMASAKDALFDAQGDEALTRAREAEQIKADEAEEALRAAEEALRTAREEGAARVEEARLALEDARRGLGRTAAEDVENAPAWAEIALQIREKQREAAQLRALREADCVLRAPGDGVVEEVRAQQGGVTSQEALFVLTAATEGFQFHGKLSREDAERLAQGDAGTIGYRLGGERLAAPATIRSVGAPDDEGVCVVTADLKEGQFRSGLPATLTVSHESGSFSAVLPLSALRHDSGDYVLVVRERDTVMGKQATAYRVKIEVIDQDGDLMAVEGPLLPDEPVIAGANRAVEAGDPVVLPEGA